MLDRTGSFTTAPTSDILRRLLDTAPGETVTLDWVVDELDDRSFGLIMLILALLTLVPGISYFATLLVIWVAVQMILKRPGPRLPRIISAQAIRRDRFTRVLGRAVPVMRWLERFVRPRWSPLFAANERVLGVMLFLLGLSLTIPLPLSNYLPAFVIVALALAWLEQDGLLLIIGVVASLLSYAVSIASVWALIYGVNMLAGL